MDAGWHEASREEEDGAMGKKMCGLMERRQQSKMMFFLKTTGKYEKTGYVGWRGGDGWRPR